jgi:hypothetical protein
MDGILNYFVELYKIGENGVINVNKIVLDKLKELSPNVVKTQDKKTPTIEKKAEVVSLATSNPNVRHKCSPSPTQIAASSKKLLLVMEQRQRSSEPNINLSSNTKQHLDPPIVATLTLPNSDYLLTSIATIHSPSHFYVHLISPECES